MLGFGKQEHTVDPTTLPIFVHAITSVEAFDLARKVWENNARYILMDNGNQKELLRFVFNDPPCVVWLERDQGRTDTFELVMLWDKAGKQADVSEVYVLTTSDQPRGDDGRAKSLLTAILTNPSIVPVNNNPTNAAGPVAPQSVSPAA